MNQLATKHLSLADSDDLYRLENSLAGLASPIAVSRSGRRILSAPDPGALLACVLREIDETVLPRQIDIETQSGLVAHLQVGARRLVHLDIDRETVAVRDAAGTPDDTARWLAGRLLAFVSGAGELAVGTRRMTFDRNPADLGCAARHMARVALVEIDRDLGGTAVYGCFEAIGQLSAAWLSLDQAGRVIDCDGRQSETKSLVDLCDNSFAELETQLTQTSGAPGSPSCLMLDNSAIDGWWLIYARAKDARLLALVSPQAVAGIQPIWQQYFGATCR